MNYKTKFKCTMWSLWWWCLFKSRWSLADKEILTVMICQFPGLMFYWKTLITNENITPWFHNEWILVFKYRFSSFFFKIVIDSYLKERSHRRTWTGFGLDLDWIWIASPLVWTQADWIWTGFGLNLDNIWVHLIEVGWEKIQIGLKQMWTQSDWLRTGNALVAMYTVQVDSSLHQ